MPRLTRWFIKAALLYLVAALGLALALAAPPSAKLPAFIRFMSPTYFHLFMVGWVSQMIFGVVYWMFPIISRARPRGNEQVGWAVFVLLNAGLLLRFVGEPLVGISTVTGLGWLLAASGLLQWTAGALFVYLAWPRVKDRYRGE